MMIRYQNAGDPAESEYRIPAVKGAGEPDLTRATFSRVAELCMVAYDTNAPESQVLQLLVDARQFSVAGNVGYAL